MAGVLLVSALNRNRMFELELSKEMVLNTSIQQLRAVLSILVVAIIPGRENVILDDGE